MESKTIIQALAALAQESRLALFRLLVQTGPSGLSAGEIGAELGIAPATLSFHLKELARADLIAARQDGRYIYYSANFTQMALLVGFLTENCCARDGVWCAPAACRTPGITKAAAARANPKQAQPAQSAPPKRHGIKS